MSKLYGIIGYPVKHTFSPAMHNAAFKALGIDAEYVPFEIKPQDLRDFLLKDVFKKNLSGFNITIPHKVEAKKILEEKYPFHKNPQQDYYVELSGAVNTVKVTADRLEYFNTDAYGFLEALTEGELKFDPKRKKVFVFGCGGAGRAVIAGLSWIQNCPKNIYIYDVNNDTVESAKKHFSGIPRLENVLQFISSQDVDRMIEECDLLVNASPIGMKDGSVPLISTDLLHKKLAVFDLVYNRETELIKAARLKGLNVSGGLDMLLYQGVLAFGIWADISIHKTPVEVMREALTAQLK